jgi:hypothetical protein
MNRRLTSKIIMALLCLTTTAFAQKTEVKDLKTGITYVTRPSPNNPFPDSIRVEFPGEKSVVVFQLRNVTKNIKSIEEFPAQLKAWLTIIATAIPDTSTPHQVFIKAKENGESEISIEEPKTKIARLRSDQGTVTELLPPGWEISASFKDLKVYVYGQTFKGLETVATQSFDIVREKIKTDIDSHPLLRKSLNSRMIYQDHQINYIDVKRKWSGDFIDLSGSGGFGFVGDKFYPELDLNVSLRFSSRYKKNNQKVSFMYQNLFFAEKKSDGGYSNRTNSFLSVSWSKNLTVDKGTPQWFGLGAGYLIQKKGDYFTGKTVKFFVAETLGHFTVSPEFYLTNDFRNFQMGFKLSYNF